MIRFRRGLSSLTPSVQARAELDQYFDRREPIASIGFEASLVRVDGLRPEARAQSNRLFWQRVEHGCKNY
jgi:hypothetical protein